MTLLDPSTCAAVSGGNASFVTRIGGEVSSQPQPIEPLPDLGSPSTIG